MSAWGPSFGLAWGDAFGGSVTPGPVALLLGGDDAPKRKRDDIAADIKTALAQLERVTDAAETIATTAVPFPRFEPANVRLIEALNFAQSLVAQAETRVQRTRLQISIENARDARNKLMAREEAAKAIAKARVRRAVAFLTIILGDE